MADIPIDRILMAVTAIAIIAACVELALAHVAPWSDIYTIFLMLLSGMGFVSAGYYSGQAKAYQTMAQLAQEKADFATKKATAIPA